MNFLGGWVKDGACPFLIIFGLLLFSPSFLNAQNSNLYQKWILKDVLYCPNIKTDILDLTKWNVEFNKLNKAIITFSKSDVRKQNDFKFVNNRLVMNDISYSIDKINRDSLVLGMDGCKRFLFLAKDRLLEMQKQQYFIHKGDTIYFSSDVNAPKLKGYPNYMEYITGKLPGINNMEGNCLIQLQFIVRDNGLLTDARGKLSCMKKSDKKIDQVISDMAGLWEPMILEGKPVNALIRIKIDHSGRVVHRLNK